MRTSQPRRRGTIVPLMALCVTGLFGFVALAVDLGILAVTRTQCQNAADAAALAGARQLNNSTAAVNNNAAAASTQARTTVTANTLLNTPFTTANISAVDIGTYSYNTVSQRF
jgi:outer membrane autotransporter protein